MAKRLKTPPFVCMQMGEYLISTNGPVGFTFTLEGKYLNGTHTRQHPQFQQAETAVNNFLSGGDRPAKGQEK